MRQSQSQRTGRWSEGFGLSVLLHLALVALVVFGAAAMHALPLGGAHPGTAGAGAIEANLVSSVPGGAIPMPSPTNVQTENRLASGNPGTAISRATAPPPPARHSVALPAPPKLPDLAHQEALRDLDQLARADVQKKDDRVAYGAGGPASFNYSVAGQGVGGGGGMAFGDAAFGNLYTDWVNHLRDRLTFYWSRQYRDPSTPVGRMVTIQFVVTRTGQLQDIGFAQRTNIPDLDSMALHAVEQTAVESFPLPAGYAHASLAIQVSFELR